MNGYVRAYEGNDPYIFVSYAHKDGDKVLPVIRQLYGQKYRVWYDEGIAPGSEWPLNIARHLRKAAAVIVFVSEYSLVSSYCDIEVMTAIGEEESGEKQSNHGKPADEAEKKKKMIQISLDDGARHTMLSDAITLDFSENLINELTNGDVLGDELIGDGITGYEYSIDKKRSFNPWNLILGLAAALAIVFSVSLYGLYNGWFDSLLPARQPAAEAAAPTAEPQAAIAIDNTIIGSVLPVRFSSDEEKNAVYEKLGWEQPYEMTYKDLMEMEGVKHLEIWDEPIDTIEFAAYLPNLETVTLSSSHITDLSPLIECPNLTAVQVTADMLPMTLPADRNFEVEVI